MRTTVLTAIAFSSMAALPALAWSQPLPDGIDTAIRSRVETRLRPILYGQGNDREEQTERLTKVFRLGANGELVLGNIAGDIVVTKGGGSEATVEIVKTARSRAGGQGGRTQSIEDAREMLRLVQIDVTERAGRAEVKTRYPDEGEMRRVNRRNINVSVAYTVTAPEGTRLTVTSISGSIKVSDIKGDLSLNTISGTLHVTNAGRIATAKSVSGSVEITNTQIDGGVQAESISGSIILRRVRARRLELGVISGNVVLQDVECDRVEAHSISGEVEFSGVLAKNGRYELTSHSGDVRVTVAGDPGFELEANSFSGSVRSDLPITLRGVNGSDRGRRRAIHGVYGDGSAVLNVTTFSGSIVISKR